MITVSGVVRFAMETKPSYQENIPEPVKEFFEERGDYEPPINITTFFIKVWEIWHVFPVELNTISRAPNAPVYEWQSCHEY